MSERRLRANRQKAEAGKWQTANRTFGYTMDDRLSAPCGTHGCVVTIKPCPPRLRKFDSDFVHAAWRQGE